MPQLHFLYTPAAHRHLHSFPTRRSSDLAGADLKDDVERALCAIQQIHNGGGAQEQQHGDDARDGDIVAFLDRKSTRLNSSHTVISYAVFCLKKKTRAQ